MVAGSMKLDVDGKGVRARVTPMSTPISTVIAQLRSLVKQPGSILAEVGHVEAALEHANTRVVAEYVVPYLATSTGTPFSTYRPAFVHHVDVGLDRLGLPIAWSDTVAWISADAAQWRPPALGDLVASPYLTNAPARRISLHSPRLAAPAAWRPPCGHTHAAFAIESVVDELAHASRIDPLAYRVMLLRERPRFAAVLERAAGELRWGSGPAEGHARGLAVHASSGTIVAYAVEVSADAGDLRIHEIACAVDGAAAVDPREVEAQIRDLLRPAQRPRVRIQVTPGNALGLVGALGVAPLAPAVANAVFALTGQRLRTMPLPLA